jgi:hypothetical protein
MKPITFADFLEPQETRGRRNHATVYATLTIRRLASVAVREFYPGQSKCWQAERLRSDLLRYQAGAFRRSTGPACADRHRGKIEEVCHRILRLRDRVPAARTIRRWL